MAEGNTSLPVGTRVWAWLSSMPFRRVVWFLPIAFAVHEAEEWNIAGWHASYWSEPPGYDDATIRTWLVFITVVGFLWTAFASIFRNPKMTAWIVLPFFVLSVFANALQHLALLFLSPSYLPGTATALLVAAPAIVFVSVRALREGLVPLWYLAVLYVGAIPQMVSIVRTGRTFPDSLRSLLDFADRLAGLFQA